MAGNQPTITGVWGLGQHRETAHFKINYAIKTVLFFFPCFLGYRLSREVAEQEVRVQPRLSVAGGRGGWLCLGTSPGTDSCQPRVFFFSWECGCACCSEGKTFKGSLVIFPPKQSRIIFPCPFVRPLSITELIIFPLVSTYARFLPKAWEDPCSQLWV